MAFMSYAQNREDVLLNRLFADRSSGFYIDVGAYHPVFNSVTKLFYDRGWNGINIEPIPSLSEMFAQDRQRDINLRIGISNREEASTLYECLNSLEASTFSRELAESLRGQGCQLVEHSVPVTTLARVCEQYAVPTIDFLKIDVESYEREVLEGADWSRYRPRVIVVEATRPATNIPSHEDWESLLLEANYLFAFFDGLNRYYVRSEDREWLSLLSVPANLFDHYVIYEYHRQIEELRQTCDAVRQSLENSHATQGMVEVELLEARNSLVEMQRAMDESGMALRGTRAQLDATQAQLSATQAQLSTAQAQLSATQAQLAPFQDLGPIAISVARQLRRMSLHSPRLASITKQLIRHVDSRTGVLVPDK
jgi:FkbM family methyltransferase